ncbi:AroM family protein [Photobacterium sanctipauli]|nr:AroM family protein [Photobacterium sanctipauli]
MAKSPLLGIVTIGQSPRSDIHADMKALLGENLRWVEEGALDGLTRGDIEKKYPIAGKHDLLVSRMANGEQVCISESDLEPRLFDAVARIKDYKPDVVIILCTGDLPPITMDRCVVLSPQHIIKHFVAGLGITSLIVMSPEQAQVDNAKKRWEEAGFHTGSVFGSPYQAEAQLYQAAVKAKELSGNLIILDCMGYKIEHREKIEKWSGKRTITPREIIFNTVRTLFGP